MDCGISGEGVKSLELSGMESREERSETKKKKRRRLWINGMRVSDRNPRNVYPVTGHFSEGGFMYDYSRGSGREFPGEVKRFADLAIASYNESNPMKYSVVEIIRASKMLCAGFFYRIKFTAKLPDQNDADALTFRARIYDGITRVKVKSIRVVGAPATAPITGAPAVSPDCC
ncbi:hypothetical protein ABFS82_06G080000 [Erythranthe guttata]|uniref:Cystatin domain-containing protein n=1 Tax=Erythranthe guttata TaxID=4155 RepID=A0A022PU33_ERYGU|nr:PREDICTED: uncharacterized protein LOC105977414 [Erythranthe guttata]EYU19872.1 hypothetical protein MIMGU_mgv1a014956mg [Erythranthe guttata]|eukprot:XP_012858175.1 PREDICTED: uncharacterized protein LOC105977414 [Erythranthe guttata]